jgi:hypothetical protein
MLFQAVFMLFLGFVSMSWGQGSADNLARAQEGMGERSFPKKPNDQISAFAGKMFESKEIQIKKYKGGQSELKQQLYASAENSDYNTRHLQAFKESPYSVRRNEWSEAKRSNMDGIIQADLEERQASTFQKKSEIQMSGLTSKEGPNWVTRRSPQYHQKNGERRMYEGHLVRVREKVSREEGSTQRDLGVGKQEIFNPDEVQKMLKPKNKPNELKPIFPLDQQVKAESESASLPVVVDSSLDSP